MASIDDNDKYSGDIIERLERIEKKLDAIKNRESWDLPSFMGEILDSLEEHVSFCSKFEKIKIVKEELMYVVGCSCDDPRCQWVVLKSQIDCPSTYLHKKIFYEKLDELSKKYGINQEERKKQERMAKKKFKKPLEGIEV